ncbi:MAG: FHA domain-containing protein [Clostridium sp.]|nr:FHA domain-containing protein [Clostridium sp.]
MRTITIGRSSSCDIVVPDNSVSRIHAEISMIDGKYLFRDTSSNGSTLNGEYISNRAVGIAPGAPVLLANRIPLPWAQIYALLPIRNGGSNRVYEPEGRTNVGLAAPPAPAPAIPVYSDDDPSPVGWCILSFLIPLVGWILYFSWKSTKPQKASAVCTWAWIGFGLNVILSIASIG